MGPSAKAWVERVTGCPLAEAWELQRTSSDVFAVDAADGRALVLRLFTDAAWNAREPDLAAREAAALRRLETVEIPTPALIAVDPSGAEAGHPATLMERLPGEPDLGPRDPDAWLRGLAAPLPILHAHDYDATIAEFFRYTEPHELAVPRWTAQPHAWSRAIEILRGPEPVVPTSFIHRDYHPGNVLWSRGVVTGVIDWVNACLGPAPFDAAHCRLNITDLIGLDAADRFARPDPYWDLRAAADWLPPEDDRVKTTLDRFVASAVSRYA